MSRSWLVSSTRTSRSRSRAPGEAAAAAEVGDQADPAARRGPRPPRPTGSRGVVRHRERLDLEPGDLARLARSGCIDAAAARRAPQRGAVERAGGGVDRQPELRRASRSAPRQWSLCSWVRTSASSELGVDAQPLHPPLELAAGEPGVDQEPVGPPTRPPRRCRRCPSRDEDPQRRGWTPVSSNGRAACTVWKVYQRLGCGAASNATEGYRRSRKSPGIDLNSWAHASEKYFPATTYSPTHVTQAVPSALRGLTAVFGMGTGVSPSPQPPEKPKFIELKDRTRQPNRIGLER